MTVRQEAFEAQLACDEHRQADFTVRPQISPSYFLDRLSYFPGGGFQLGRRGRESRRSHPEYVPACCVVEFVGPDLAGQVEAVDAGSH